MSLGLLPILSPTKHMKFNLNMGSYSWQEKRNSVRHQNRISSKMLLRAENGEEVKYYKILQRVNEFAIKVSLTLNQKSKLPSESPEKTKNFLLQHISTTLYIDDC